MTVVFTPSIDLALGVLAALVLSGIVFLIRRTYHRRRVAATQYRVVEFEGGIAPLQNALRSLNPPFTMEVAVHQLGRDVHVYLAVPSAKADWLIQETGGKEVTDYNIYHPGGAHIGGTLMTKSDSANCIDVFMQLLKDLDFSKVNEVGEGVVFQLVFGQRSRGGWTGNVRVLVSAPTPYQAREILSDLEQELSGCRWTEEKGDDFIRAVTYRKFDPGKGMAWTLS